MKLLKIVLLTTFLFLLSFQTSFAQSSYVLPYPSYMPGNLLYKVHLGLEYFEKYWYFGNFGQFAYNLKQSDKYLVEAKTLFEYKQYFLGVRALRKSDSYFNAALHFLQKASSKGINITGKKELFKNAGLKHNEVLLDIKSEVPQNFLWEPEKQSSSRLNIWDDIDNSLKVIKSCI